MVVISEIVGGFKRYHFWICFIIFMNKFGVAFHQMAILFLAPPVKFTCPGNASCCDNPVYDRSVFKRTIIMEWNLICGRSYLKDLEQTIFQFGVLSGSIVFGMASDRYGRRPTLIICVILEVFTGLMTSFLPDYWSFTIVRAVLGASIGGVMVIGFVHLMEYVGNYYRDTISALYHVPFCAGNVLLAVFGYFIRDYVYFQLSISLSNVILLTYICILPESPRWLLAMMKTNEAVILLERIAKINKMPADDIRQKVELYQLEHTIRTAKKGTVLDLFRTPNLRKHIIVMSLAWLVVSFYYYGVSHYICHLTGDIYINVLASGIVCLCACFLAIPIMKFMGRRKIVIFGNVACSVCILVLPLIPQGIGSIVLGCSGILCSYTVFVVLYLYCSEMFPTVVRNAALGFCSMLARCGGMIAPFAAGLRPYGIWIAPVVFGLPPLLSAVSIFWLPETKNCELMMTVAEGEAFGKQATTQRQTPTEIANDGVT